MHETTTVPGHGTLSRYVIHKCRCEQCRETSRAYANRRTRLEAYGQWTPYVDADPVRSHLAMLSEYGIGWMRAAALAGVPTGNVSKILYGTRNPPRPPSRRVRTTTAARILALRPTLDLVADNARVPATGTRRRIQALMALGYTQTYLAAQVGAQHTNFRRVLANTHVRAHTARKIAALYDRLWDTDPQSLGISRQGSRYARTVAEQNGWAPPLAWDDDAIDDPAAMPSLGESGRRQDALIEDAEFIVATTGTDDLSAIAERLGISRNYLDKARERHRAELARAA